MQLKDFVRGPEAASRLTEALRNSRKVALQALSEAALPVATAELETESGRLRTPDRPVRLQRSLRSTLPGLRCAKGAIVSGLLAVYRLSLMTSDGSWLRQA